MKYTLKNGAVIEGDVAQIVSVAKALGETVSFDDGLHYQSKTRGLMRISDMDTNHLRNALVARYAEFVESLRSNHGLTHDQVAREVVEPTDKTLVGLMAELNRRLVRGTL